MTVDGGSSQLVKVGFIQYLIQLLIHNTLYALALQSTKRISNERSFRLQV